MVATMRSPVPRYAQGPPGSRARRAPEGGAPNEAPRAARRGAGIMAAQCPRSGHGGAEAVDAHDSLASANGPRDLRGQLKALTARMPAQSQATDSDAASSQTPAPPQKGHQQAPFAWPVPAEGTPRPALQPPTSRRDDAGSPAAVTGPTVNRLLDQIEQANQRRHRPLRPRGSSRQSRIESPPKESASEAPWYLPFSACRLMRYRDDHQQHDVEHHGFGSARPPPAAR